MSKRYPPIKIINDKKYFFRFNLNLRIQHIVFAASIIILVLTGMPLKFSGKPWASYLYSIFGGIQVAPWVHKISGVVMLIVFVYHMYWVVRVIQRNHIQRLRQEENLSFMSALKAIITLPMVPNLKDARDIGGLMKYLLYFTNKRPDGDEYTWKEKFDYWAPFWGCFIIGLTGIVIWNKEFFTQVIPGDAINLCLIAHSDEALLAALFLFIWHWYNVHFSTSVFPMGTVFLTGYLPEELMVEEHYQYYVKVMKEQGLENEIEPPHGGHRQSPCDSVNKRGISSMNTADLQPENNGRGGTSS